MKLTREHDGLRGPGISGLERAARYPDSPRL